MSWRDTVKNEDAPKKSWRDTVQEDVQEDLARADDEVRGLLEQKTSELGRATLQALPAVGGIAGGLLGGSMGAAAGGVGAVPGAMVGAGAGSATGAAVENFIRRHFLDEDVPLEEVLTGPVREAALGAAGEGAGAVLAKGIQALPGLLRAAPKPNAEAVKQASQRLGFEATPGMVSESRVMQGLESSLEQSPSLGGWLFRRGTTEPMRKGVQGAAEGLFESVPKEIPSDVGRGVKAGAKKVLEDRLAPIVQTYENIRGSTEFIPVNPQSTNRVAKSFLNQYSKFPNSPESRAASSLAENLSGIQTVDDIKSLRGQVGRLLRTSRRAGDDSTSRVYADLYGRLSRMEKNTILREAVKQARTTSEGKQIGMEIVNDLKGANKQFKQVIDDVQLIAQRSGLKRPQDAADFLEILDDVPDEAVAEKLFNTKDKRALDALERVFPEQFDSLKQAKLSKIMDQATVSGELRPKRLVQAVQKMDEHTVTFLFGDKKAKILKDLKTVTDNLPEKIGPSGTPQGLDFMNFLNPVAWPSELGRLGQLGLLKTRMKGISPMRVDPRMLTPMTQPAVRGLLGDE